MALLDDSQVSAAPSGKYGFYTPTNRHKFEAEPVAVVQIAQFIEGVGWASTPARHYATTVALSNTVGWSIDMGQNWSMDEIDTDAFKDYARQVLVADALI